MYAGRVVEAGATDDIIDRPRHPYTVGLLGSVPSANRAGERLTQIPGMTPNMLSLPQGCAFRERCTRADGACSQDPEIDTDDTGHSVRCFHPHRTEVPA